jgi:integrase
MGDAGRIFARGKRGIQWIAYYAHGREIRESSHSTSQRIAQRLLTKRLAEVQIGQFSGVKQDRLTFFALWAGVIRDYEINEKRSIRMLRVRLAHLEPFFGDMRAIEISTAKVEEYKQQRKRKGASNASINRELALLRRAFRIATEAGHLNTAPKFRMLEENNARGGFFEQEDFQRVRVALPEYLKLPISFLYLSGWRVDEMRKLRWSDVDLEAASILLPKERSKNKQARTLALAGELLKVIRQAHAIRRRDCPFVFYRFGVRARGLPDGQPIGQFDRSWKLACQAAGVIGRIVHDFRRTAIRNMVRAGVPERVAMEISGHRTREVFERYNIVSESVLRLAQERLSDYLRAQGTKVTEDRNGYTVQNTDSVCASKIPPELAGEKQLVKSIS